MDKNLIILICIVAAVILICFLLSIASFSGEKFFKIYKKMQSKTTKTGYTASLFISELNSKYFDKKIHLQEIQANYGDYYDSGRKTIAINLKNENSLATLAVIAHEMGHAYQDVVEHKLASLNSLRRTGMIVGKLFLPTLFLGIVATFLIQSLLLVLGITAGILIFIVMLAISIKAKTLAIEKDATKRGLEFLREILPEDEVKQCKKLLDSAKMTYWADLLKLLFSWSGLTSKTEMFK